MLGTLRAMRIKQISWTVAVVGVAALLVVGVVVWRTLASGVAAGTVIPVDRLGPGHSRQQTVRLPNIQLALAITEPTGSWPHGVDARSANQQDQAKDGVAGGGRFVGVSWSQVSSDLPLSAVAVAGATTPTLTLVADGRRYPLPPGASFDTAPAAVYVAVHGHPDHVAVEVSFDGANQRFDESDAVGPDHAAATPYYDSAALARNANDATACVDARVRLTAGHFDPGGDEEDPHFEVPEPIVAVPYADGLGWAASGRSWLVVTITTRFNLGTFVTWPRPGVGADHEALYLPQLRRTTVTVDGQRPRTSVNYFQGTPAKLASENVSGARYVFDVATGRHTLRFAQVYADTADARDLRAVPGAPKKVVGRVGCSFHIG